MEISVAFDPLRVSTGTLVLYVVSWGVTVDLSRVAPGLLFFNSMSDARSRTFTFAPKFYFVLGRPLRKFWFLFIAQILCPFSVSGHYKTHTTHDLFMRGSSFRFSALD